MTAAIGNQRIRTDHFDFAVIGTGPGGSLLSWILAKRGRKVLMFDRRTHPRFAIGESSTPIADSTLLRLSDRYGLQTPAPLARWGTWQQVYPQLAGGMKRGFSYFRHEVGATGVTDTASNRLLVAASPDDAGSDCHWFRADIDRFLFDSARQAGAVGRQATELARLSSGPPWNLRLRDAAGEAFEATADFLIDAGGRGGLLARLLNLPDTTHRMLTRTQSTYTHVDGLQSWSEVLREQGAAVETYPFDADDAAQHHLVRNGWIWVLRFNNGRTSVGWTRRCGAADSRTSRDPTSEDLSGALSLDDYPLLRRMFAPAGISESPGRIHHVPRLQHRVGTAAGPCFALLPTAVATLDPLHSTGLAHAFTGVERLAAILLDEDSRRDERLAGYAQHVQLEIDLLDQLVSTAYRAMPSMPHFTAACMLYFAVAIRFEEGGGAALQRGGAAWDAADRHVRAAVAEGCRRIRRAVSVVPFGAAAMEAQLRPLLRSLTAVPLLCPEADGLYAYTAATKA